MIFCRRLRSALPSSVLLALPAFLAIRYRDLTPRVTALDGCAHLSLAADVYALANIAINGQRGRHKGNREPEKKHCGQKRK
jgi:hypothetical protein